MADYPINGCDLARQILGRQLRGEEDRAFVQGTIRALLREFGCPKTSDSPRANWVVDEAMAMRVHNAIPGHPAIPRGATPTAASVVVRGQTAQRSLVGDAAIQPGQSGKPRT